MKQSTIIERKRFAADLADRDALLRTRRADVARDAAVSPGGTDEGAYATALAPSYARALPPTDRAVLQAYKLRRWWLDRYTLDEIRELAGCLL